MIITAAVLLAAAAVVTGSRLIRHPEKSNTKKSEVADQKNSEKEQDHRTSGTERSEKKQNMNEPDHTQKEQSVENADRTGKSITEEAFYISKIPDDIFEKMQGKSYKADCTVPREDLRYLHVLHMGFDGQTKEGELVVNKAIAEDVLAIFRQLYEAEYPIEKVRLVDEYDADDEASMSDNNSSAFNFRFISHTTKISKHGLGMAVDINTLYNPYVKTVNGDTPDKLWGRREFEDFTPIYPDTRITLEHAPEPLLKLLTLLGGPQSLFPGALLQPGL